MRNPPWTDKLLNKYWTRLEAVVGAAWMPIPHFDDPKLQKEIDYFVRVLSSHTFDAEAKQRADVALQKAKSKAARNEELRIIKGYREYGCGHYGCVMPTQTPGVVIKITTDPTEATFVAAYLSLPQRERPVGIIPYHRIVAIRGESRLKRPVFAIWREEADHVGTNALRAWIRDEAPSAQRSYYSHTLDTVEDLIANCLWAARTVRFPPGSGATDG